MSFTLNDCACTIANGESLSGPIYTGNAVPVGLVMPAGWTAAVITFQASADGGETWLDLFDTNDNEVSITVGASRHIALEGLPFASTQYLKLRSGTSAAAVNQAAERNITVLARRERG